MEGRLGKCSHRGQEAPYTEHWPGISQSHRKSSGALKSLHPTDPLPEPWLVCEEGCSAIF